MGFIDQLLVQFVQSLVVGFGREVICEDSNAAKGDGGAALETKTDLVAHGSVSVFPIATENNRPWTSWVASSYIPTEC